MKRWQIIAGIVVVLAALVALDQRGERPRPAAASVTPAVAAAEPVDYYRDIRPILDNRCLVCHGCYDAPCQLRLDTPEGLQRGATKAKIYDGTRLAEAPPTRLFIDAQDVAQWRGKGFFPVLNEAADKPQANLDGSVLYRLLVLKRQHPLPNGFLPESFDLSLDRREFCPSPERVNQYARERPLEGMPFALPGLSKEEFSAFERWLGAGAPIAAPAPLSGDLLNRVASWERFLNGEDLKTQLMARYLYEHLFLADLYFEDVGERQFFKLVRSATAPGAPLDVIATRRPFDDPGAARAYYRLQPLRGTVVAKTHMPYALSEKRMQRYRALFLQPDYRVAALPSYAPEVASNPFVAFADLPVRSRYRFLLDEAEFSIMNFIKGPVCRGQVALNVIDDRFWVLFANPDIDAAVDGEFLARQSRHLRLPAADRDNPLAAADWRRYAKLQAEYLVAKKQFLHEKFGKPAAVTLQLLWNGEQSNTNAALTVFRHFDSASVVRGLVGETPKTAWVVDYPMLERIHYLLVAGFDIYGNANHQLQTRLYMDFLRMEGEYNYLAFLPKARRDALRNSWYQGIGAKARDSVYRQVPAYQHETGVIYRGKDFQDEFFEQVRAHLGAALEQRHALTQRELPEPMTSALQRLQAVRGRPLAFIPEAILLRVIRKNAEDEIFSVLHNADHSNVAVLFLENERRRPQFDTLTVLPGIVPAYPNAFWRVSEENLPQLVQALHGLNSAESYRAFLKRFGVLRSSDRFWRQSDWIHNTYREREPIAWGVLDYSRYEK